MKERRAKAVIWFDECINALDECAENCANKPSVLCGHRLNFNPHIIIGARVAQGFLDFRVILRFFNMIRKGKFHNLSPNPLFILITRDQRFFQSVIHQAETKRKANLKFHKKRKEISCGTFMIRVLKMKWNDTGKDSIRKKIILSLNNALARTKSC